MPGTRANDGSLHSAQEGREPLPLEKAAESGGSNWFGCLCGARFQRKTALLQIAAALLSLQAAWGAQPGDVLWSYDFGFGNNISSWCPALAADGTVYVGTAAGFFAITNNGTAAAPKWALTNIIQATTPAVASDGTIYVYGAGEAVLHALNPDSSAKWSTNFAYRYWYPMPAIGRDNTVYLARDGYLYAYSPTGAENWRCLCTNTGDYISPAVAPDGTVYISGAWAGSIWAISPAGTPKWSFPLGSFGASLSESVAIGKDGTIYSAAGYANLYALTPDGNNLWIGTPASPYSGSAAVGADGTIYLGDGDGLNAFDPSGGRKWHTVVGGYWHGSPRAPVPAIDANGMIYFCASNNVWALNSAGIVQWMSPGLQWNDRSSPVISPVLATDGTLYACFGTTLYALYYGSTPGDGPWPTDRQNARHTGKVEKPWLRQPVRRNDGTVTFQLYGQLGEPFTIQGSTDLSIWMPLTNLLATAVPMDLVDTAATNFSVRFYRASSP
jgi:hypothetical protein